MNRIKMIFGLVGMIFANPVFAQYGFIQDPDGFVNVRPTNSLNSKVIAKLNNGEVVSIINEYSDHNFNYVLNSELPTDSGFIHKSRINRFQGFQKWEIESNSKFHAQYRSGQGTVKIETQQAQINPKDFKFGSISQPFQRYKNKDFFGTDGQLPTGSLQFKSIEVQWNGKKISLSSKDLEQYFFPSTPRVKGGKQDFAEAEIYSKDKDLYIINTLAVGGAAQYTLIIHIQNGKVISTRAWNESI